MKRHSTESSPLYPKILFRFTDHPITVWAGVILLRVYFEWVELRKELARAGVGGIRQAVEQSNYQREGDVGLVLRLSIGQVGLSISPGIGMTQ